MMPIFRALIIATRLVITCMIALVPTPVASSPAVHYNNTLVSQRADAHVYKHTDGFYYFTATVPAYDKVILRRSQTIQGLTAAPETTIFTRKKGTVVGSGQVWAPEIHYINGKWYVYVSLGVANEWRIRPFVLEGKGDNPLTATWVEKGIIKTNRDTFSLDASTFVVNQTRYLIWAQTDGDGTAILIAPMENPWTIRGTPTVISRPDQSWERIGHNVNEGPFVIQKNGKVFLTYSAAATDANYCLGMLTASASSDLMKANSWKKSTTPVFVSNSKTSQFGPGHNSFTISEDGESDIMIYHDRGYRDIKGDPLNDPNRRTRVQKLYWKADGTPDFGIPVPDGETPVRLRSYMNQSLFITQKGTVQADVANLAETQFRIIKPGLAGGSTVSLESTSNPGSFLRRSGTRLRLDAKESSTVFTTDASFNQRPGMANGTGVSFEAVDATAQYIRAEDDNGVVLSVISGEKQQGQATFLME